MTDDNREAPDKAAEGGPDGAVQEFLPPLDFSSIVFPFYTQALVKLGVLKDPVNPESGQNLDLARRLIDLLDLLKERTKGNLTPEELKFLETCLQQPRLGYLDRAKADR
jgi:hypothetical protein